MSGGDGLGGAVVCRQPQITNEQSLAKEQADGDVPTLGSGRGYRLSFVSLRGLFHLNPKAISEPLCETLDPCLSQALLPVVTSRPEWKKSSHAIMGYMHRVAKLGGVKPRSTRESLVSLGPLSHFRPSKTHRQSGDLAANPAQVLGNGIKTVPRPGQCSAHRLPTSDMTLHDRALLHAA